MKNDHVGLQRSAMWLGLCAAAAAAVLLGGHRPTPGPSGAQVVAFHRSGLAALVGSGTLSAGRRAQAHDHVAFAELYPVHISAAQWQVYEARLATLAAQNEADRAWVFAQLSLSATGAALAETLLATDTVLEAPQAWEAQLTHAALTPYERSVLQTATALLLDSERQWASYEAQLAPPPDTTLDPDAYRKLRRRRIAKADAFGLFKGLVAGAWWYGGDNLLWEVNDALAVQGALGVIAVLPVIESFRYARKLRKVPEKVFDDPWWGPNLPPPRF